MIRARYKLAALLAAGALALHAGYLRAQATKDAGGNPVLRILGIPQGGTGAATAAGARTNLGLGAAATQAVPSGLVKGDGSAFSAAVAGADYLTPAGNGSGLTNLSGAAVVGNIPGNAAGITGGIAESSVTGLVADLAARAPLASPALTGVPTAPTAAPGTNTTQLATTAFVQASGPAGALIAANNLSDLTNVAAARTSLGLGTAATQASSAFLGPIAGGAGRIPFEDGSGQLVDSANLAFAPSTGTLTSGAPAGHRIVMDAKIGDHPRISFVREDNSGFLLFDWYFDGGGSPAYRFQADHDGNLFSFIGGNPYEFQPQVGFSTAPLGNARLSVSTAAQDRVGLAVRASALQSADVAQAQDSSGAAISGVDRNGYQYMAHGTGAPAPASPNVGAFYLDNTSGATKLYVFTVDGWKSCTLNLAPLAPLLLGPCRRRPRRRA